MFFSNPPPEPKWIFDADADRYMAANVQSTMFRGEKVVDLLGSCSKEEYFRLCLGGKEEEYLLELWAETL